jgi:phenol 2-monooxygenase
VADSFAYDSALESDPQSYPIQLTLRTLSDSEANPPPAPGAFGGRDVIAKGNLPHDELHNETGTSNPPGHIELVKAKYLIGCDGTHSWLRQQLKYELHGESAHSVW